MSHVGRMLPRKASSSSLKALWYSGLSVCANLIKNCRKHPRGSILSDFANSRINWRTMAWWETRSTKSNFSSTWRSIENIQSLEAVCSFTFSGQIQFKHRTFGPWFGTVLIPHHVIKKLGLTFPKCVFSIRNCSESFIFEKKANFLIAVSYFSTKSL